jgi:quercetin dioxygenase-like cupin family protein
MPFVDTRQLPRKEPLPGWDGRFFHSEQMTFGYYAVAKGASIHPHEHENEEVWHVLEGELEVTIGGETRVAGPGCAALVPPNTTHSVRARSEARAIVVDHPRRASIGNVETD